MMHILFIPSAYPTEEMPLSSIFYKEQAVAVKDKGNKLGVIFSETRRVSKVNFNMISKNHFQIGRYIEDGLVTYRLHGWNIFTMRGKLGINNWVRQSLKLFKEYVKQEGMPDIIHVQSALYGGLVAREIKKKFNIPYVVTEHSSTVLQSILRNHDIPMLEKVYNDADYIISVGGALKKSIENYTDKSIEVIPNIVDIDRFSIDISKRNKEFTFISISHLKENKNVDLTIKALKEVLKEYNYVKLIVIGDGPEKENLMNLAKELKISSNIEFIGAVHREELNEYINRANAFVLPSEYETFGIAYIEALACGLPIITTKCGGPEDFFNEEIGYMIFSEDEKELAKAMLDIINNIDRFEPNNLRKYVKDKFSKDTVSIKITNVYCKVLNRNGDINE